MVRSRFLYFGDFAVALILSLAGPLLRSAEVAATAVFDVIVPVFEKITASTFEIAALLRGAEQPEAGDTRLLPALRSHGGVGLKHQHSVNVGPNLLLC